MSEPFDYGPTKPDGQHTNHPGLPEGQKIQAVRFKYRHGRCGGETRMPAHCAETYAQNPRYYQSTFCCKCGAYFPVSEFTWPEDGKPINEPIDFEAVINNAAKEADDDAATE